MALIQRVEVVGIDGLAEEDIVVEVDEVVGDAGDAVEIQFDGRGGKGG